MEDIRLTPEILTRDRMENIPRGPYNITPLFVAKASGAILIDIEAKEYIDFAGGIGVNNVGHCAPAVVDAIKDQCEKYLHPCFHVMMYSPYIQLAKKLNQITPGNFPKKTMLMNSGAEAVENAVKIARYYTHRPAVITFEDAFHGRTLLALSLTSKMKPYKFGFGPYAPEIYRLPYAYCYRCAYGLEYPSCNLECANRLEDFFLTHISAENVAALIAEPVLGEGGFVIPPKDYFAKLKKICSDNGIIFIADEIQTGFGRCGKMFAMKYFGAEPDIIITAKSMAGGLPLSGITGRAEIMDAPPEGGLGGTFAGNPLACRAALVVIEIFEKGNLLERSNQIGKIVLEKFKELQNKFDIIGDVRGLGAMVAMELVEDRKTKKPAAEKTKLLIKKCYEKGLIIINAGTYNNVIRTLMPLVITDDQLEKGLSILEKSLSDLS